jgi:hypothetical protein
VPDRGVAAKEKDAMSEKWSMRLGAACGIIYLAIALFVEGDGSGTYSWGRADMAILGFFLLVVFVACLTTMLRSAEGGYGSLSITALGAGLLAIDVKLASLPFWAAATLAGPQVSNSQLNVTFNYMDGFGFVMSEALYAVFLLAAAYVIVRTAALPRWIGVGAALVGIGFFATAGVWTLQGPFNFSPVMLVFLLWILITSVALALKSRDKSGATRSATSTPSHIERAAVGS